MDDRSGSITQATADPTPSIGPRVSSTASRRATRGRPAACASQGSKRASGRPSCRASSGVTARSAKTDCGSGLRLFLFLLGLRRLGLRLVVDLGLGDADHQPLVVLAEAR